LLLHTFRTDCILYLSGRTNILLHRDEAIIQILLQNNGIAIKLDQPERTQTELLRPFYVELGTICHHNNWCGQFLLTSSLAQYSDLRVIDIFFCVWSIPMVRDQPTHV